MKKISATEMRSVEGGFAVVLGIALGGMVGINARISYEHKKYGKCRTYKWACSKC